MADSEEDDEELREVDPMEVVEERLMLLEAWQQEDPYNEDVEYKREEYMSLMDELEILAKKMRKTDKLLMMNNQPNRTKLERKKDQYIREVQDIVMYADQDSFFDMEGENGEAALSAYMKANSLLGKPLETLAEMTGFEDSKAWNDSSGFLDARPSREERKEARREKERQANASSSSLNTATIDLTDPGAELLLRKKVKKVKQMLLESSTEGDRKRLLKKHQQYKVKLAEINSLKRQKGKKPEDDASSTHSTSSNDSEESIDVPQNSPVKVMQNAQKRRLAASSTAASSPPMKMQEPKKKSDAEYTVLKKKLTKALKLLKESTSEKERDKLERKIPEYLMTLNTYRDWDGEKVAHGFGVDFDDGESVESDIVEQVASPTPSNRGNGDNGSSKKASQNGSSKNTTKAPPRSDRSPRKSSSQKKDTDDEYVTLKKKLAKASKMLSEASTKKERSRLDKKVSEYLDAVTQYKAWENDRSSYGYGNDNIKKGDDEEDDAITDVDDFVEQQKQVNKVVKRKLKKVEELLEEMVREEGESAKKSKDYRKLQKKRKRYLSELGEDHASLAHVSMSMSGISIGSSELASASSQTQGLEASIADASISARSIDLGSSSLGPGDWDNSFEMPKRNSACKLDPKEEEAIRKKLKKVLKMLKDSSDTREYLKLEKKRKEYMLRLGLRPGKGV